VALIWIIEDDPSIGPGLLRMVETEGHTARLARSVAEAGALAGDPEVVLLDLGLPDGDGLDLCARVVEEHPQARVIVLTARSAEMDVVLGLDAGASDYVAKPFRLSELLARIRAQLRDSGERGGTGRTTRLGGISVDEGARRVHVDGVEVHLRPKEFDLLVRLIADAGQVVRREALMSDVWDEHWFGDTKTLDVHMAALRRRLGDRPGAPSRITTIRGVGYRFEVDP
jgi:DNA-binding response OmpR family regulator